MLSNTTNVTSSKLILNSKVIYYTFFFCCLDVAQSSVNEAPMETWTHSWRFASIAYQPFQHLRRPSEQYNPHI